MDSILVKKMDKNFSEVLWIIDEKLNPQYVSPNIEKLIGYRQKDVRPSVILKMIHPKDQEMADTAHKLLISNDQLYDIEYRLQRRDGRWIWIKEKTFLVEQREGIKYYNGIYVDVTHKNRMKATQARLKNSELKYQALLARIPDILWTADSSGKLIYVSPRVETILGYSQKEYLSGIQSFIRIHPEDVPKVKESYRKLYENHVMFDEIYRYQSKNGEWIQFRDRSISTYEKDGKFLADGIMSVLKKE